MYHDLFTRRGLSLERLQALVRVADAASLISAAGSNPVLQSQFSRQLRELENYFECSLTERRGRTLVMSKAGARLAEISRLYFAGLHDFRVEQSSGGTELRFGAGERITQWMIIPRMGLIARDHQALRVSIHNATSQEIATKLQNHELDAGVIRASAAPPRPLRSSRLGILKYGLFVPALLDATARRTGHRMIRELPIADLTHAGRREVLARAVSRLAGAPVASRYSCASYPSLARLIGGGLAAGLLPRIAEQEFRNIPTRRIDLPHNSPVHETLWLIWNPRMIELAPRREKAIATIGKIIRDQLRG